jgi:hypothetical protein
VTALARLALLLLPVLAGCGVKAPPRAMAAPAQAPPSDLFRPVDDPGRPGTGFVRTDEEVAEPPPAPAPGVAAPAAPPGTPSQEAPR